MSDANTNPSMISGHAQYAKGYVEETIGNATGSTAWQESGKEDAKRGVEEMKAASQQNKSEPTASGLGGKMEQSLGSAVGCEGMENEGKERQGKAEQQGGEGEGASDGGKPFSTV